MVMVIDGYAPRWQYMCGTLVLENRNFGIASNPY